MNERDIFIGALQQPDEAARQAYLDQACGADAALRARVAGLLQVCARAGSFLEEPAAGPAGTGAEVPPPATTGEAPEAARTEQPGLVLAGRYKLLEAIGEGGMGTVWMAQQTEPVKRLVAVK